MPNPFDIQNDNFELFFEKQLEGITEAGKQALPTNLIGKLFYVTDQKTINRNQIRRIPFLGKLWILYRSLKKRIWIVVENEETGLSMEDFVALREAMKKRDFGQKKAEGMMTNATFVTGSKELGEYLDYMNYLSASPVYRYLNGYRNFKKTNPAEYKDQMDFIVRMMRHYEGNKTRWMEEKGLTLPEYYVLLYLYDKEFVKGTEMYKNTFRRANSSSPYSIRAAWSTLSSKGLIIKSGSRKGMKLRISPMGVELINYILHNYAINC
jgi:hypothetical protein